MALEDKAIYQMCIMILCIEYNKINNNMVYTKGIYNNLDD